MSKDTMVNVGVIGAGAIGFHHIDQFRGHPSARVVAVAESNAERGAAALAKFGIPKLHADYRELLARPDIDAVSIALPTYLHAPVGLEALHAGKHVLMDKPIATNAADAAALVDLAREKKLTFIVGQNMRFSGAAQAVKKLVTQGVLGEVYHAKGVWLRRSGIPRIGSWFTQQKFAGGGATYDIGVHVLDLALHLLGNFDPVSVSGQTFAKYGPRGRGDGSWGKSEIDPMKPFDVDDFAVALIKLRNGSTVQLEVSWAAATETNDTNGVQLFGTEGGATTNPLYLFRQSASGYERVEIPPATDLVPENRMAHFIDVVLGRAVPFVKPEESLAVQKVLDAIYASARSGYEVRI